MPPPIGILGAGEAGLTLARLLEVKGFEYVVFEKRAFSDSLGFWGTLDMHADTAQVVLKEAGLFEKFESVARFGTQISGVFDQHGEIITRSDIDDLPQIDWHDLRRLLLDAIPEERIRWDVEVEGVKKQADGSVSIKFADGSVESGFKLVVGADGVWSKVRELITSEVPQYSGITVLRTSISDASAFWSTVAGKLRPTNYMAIGQGKQVAAQRNVAGTYTVLVGLPLREDWTDPEVSNPSVFRGRLIRQEFEHWGPRVLNWIRHSDGEFVVRPLYTTPIESLSWESSRGLAVVGDAAHPCTPWSGEAMSCAMFDSLQLAQQIAKYGLDDLDTAVSEYEKLMFPRAIDLITKSTEIGNVFFARDAATTIEALMTGGVG